MTVDLSPILPSSPAMADVIREMRHLADAIGKPCEAVYGGRVIRMRPDDTWVRSSRERTDKEPG